MNSALKDVIQLCASIATPCIALIAVYYTRTQARTNEIRRKQELFDLRYAFYQKARNIYLTLAKENRLTGATDLFDLAEEADFLFGDDVSKHILNILDHRISEQAKHGIIDDWFTKPFKKYLTLK